MRKFLLLGAAFIVFCGFKQEPGNNNSKIIKTVKDNLYSLLGNIPGGSEDQFGFANREEIKMATVGKPYRVLTVSNEFLTTKLLDKASVADYIVENNEWRVPVKVNGDNRVLVTVISKNGSFSAEDLGGSGLAKELQHVNIHADNGHNYFILRIYQLSADFLVDAPKGNLGDATFIPLTSAHAALPALSGNIAAHNIRETLQTIKKALVNHTQN